MMNGYDRREEFKDVPWQQGRLLLTDITRRWSQEQRNEADVIEKCMAFAHFSESDEGRGRAHVYRFQSADECFAAVEAHNAELKATNAKVQADGCLQPVAPATPGSAAGYSEKG